MLSIAVAQSAGILGSLFTITDATSWYSIIEKPAWNPPNWLFGPVWITLYTLMGIAAYLVWRQKKNKETKKGLNLYIIQLVLNALWSILFFGFQQPGIALIEIFMLLGFIVATTCSFFKINTAAGWLMIPYITWVSFAAILNGTIWWLN